MDGTTLMKVEGNQFEDSCHDDGSISFPVLESAQTIVHQPGGVPLTIETTTGKVVKIKKEEPPSKQPLLSHEKASVQHQPSTTQEASEYQCELCKADGKKLKLYANKTALRVHTARVHHSTPRFQCEVCFKQFNFSSNFKKHSRGHLFKSFKCEVCSISFQDKSTLNLHLVREHDYDRKKLNVKEFPCDMCSNIYFSKFTLELHVVNAHVVDKQFGCHVCSKTFIDQEALSKHLKSHDKQSRHVCDVCSKAFKQKKGLLHHLGVEHHQFFHCDKCKKSFSNKSEFDAHSNLQQEIQNACQICNKTFPSQCSLIVHIEFHNSTEEQNQESDVEDEKMQNNSDEFTCELCLKTFDREAYIVAHRKLMHPNSLWPCSKCSKTFKLRNQMKKHELIHQEVKPHQCKFCDRSYCTAYELKVHENNTHSDRKHYKCQLCPESFTSSFGLKVHMGKFHGGEKSFKCHICCTSWVTEGYLKCHLISHRTEKLFPCEICSKSFKDLKTSKTHFREVHVIRAARKQEKIRRTEESLRELLVFICNLCQFETQDKKQVAAHYNSHGLPKITLFREPLTSATQYNLPQATHSGQNIKSVRSMEKRYKCSTCSKHFISSQRLRSHSYSHSDRKLKSCSICHTSFRRSSNLTRHLLKVHRQGRQKSRTINNWKVGGITQ